MKTVQHYICEICGTEYNDKNKAERCEKGHRPPKKIKSARYLPLTYNQKGYPESIDVEIPLTPFDRAKKEEGYLTAGEYMQKVMLGISEKNEKGEWEKAKNHKIRFFIDFRNDFSGMVPDLGKIICSQMPRCNHVPGGWISIFLIAGTLKDIEKYGPDRELLMGCCDTLIYMGGGHDFVDRELRNGRGKDEDTAKFISARTGKRLTGWDLKVLNAKNKIDALRGVHNRREVPNLISWKEVINLQGNWCILFVRGMLPILDKTC